MKKEYPHYCNCVHVYGDPAREVVKDTKGEGVECDKGNSSGVLKKCLNCGVVFCGWNFSGTA